MTKVVPLPPGFTAPAASTRCDIAILFHQTPPSAEALVQAAQAAGLPARVIEASGGPGLGASAGSVDVAARILNQPFPQDLSAQARWNYAWPEAGDVARQHRAAVLLSAQDESNPDTFTLLGTAMAYAAAIAGLPGAAAVVTVSGETFSRPDEYRAILPSVYDGMVPTLHWFSTQIARDGDQTVVGTVGLEEFGSLDFEHYGADVDFGSSYRIMQSALFDTVARLRQDPHDFPKPGDTFDVDGVGQVTVAGVTRAHLEDAEADALVYQLRFHNDQALDALLDREAPPSSPAGAAPVSGYAAGAAPATGYAAGSPGGAEAPAAPVAPQPAQSQQSAPPAQPSAAPVQAPAQAAEPETSPQYPARGLVLLAGPVDLTKVAAELQQAGVHVTSVQGPLLEATAGAYRVTLSGRPGPVPESMWTVQPPQHVCLGNVAPQQAAHAVVEVAAVDGGLGTQEQQHKLRRLVLSAVARFPQALAVVLENDRDAVPPQHYLQQQ